ncbi:MAG: TlyA family RNA methyltransferase [Myxococcota bacterium]|nr:TlyA family RNA methyltransferase [Myxococcota bacterium]
MAAKVRLDLHLVEQGHAASRDRAQRLIRAGQVLVDDRVVDKPGTRIDPGSTLRLKVADHPYVGRGGLKLQGALEHFDLPVEGALCLDVGASTGGFTDCLLQRGARQVIAVDVGTNQLAWKLRKDERVVVWEQTDIRSIEPARLSPLGGPPDLVVVDASFISLHLVLPPVIGLMGPQSTLLALIKPQFEVGKAQVGRGGLVGDDALRSQAVASVRERAEDLGLVVEGVADSLLPGARAGNREIFLLARFSDG